MNGDSLTAVTLDTVPVALVHQINATGSFECEQSAYGHALTAVYKTGMG